MMDTYAIKAQEGKLWQKLDEYKHTKAFQFLDRHALFSESADLEMLKLDLDMLKELLELTAEQASKGGQS